MKYWLSLVVLVCAVPTAWSTSFYESFEDGNLSGIPSWQVQEMHAVGAEAAVEWAAGESWLRFRCDFGAGLTEATALGAVAEGLEAREFDITSRVQMQEGFLATVNVRCDPGRLSGYAGGISCEDKLYVVRIHQGNTKILCKVELSEELEGIHQDCWIRFKTERHRLFLKVWAYGEDEPKDWQVETEDRRLRAGLAGLAVSCYSPVVGGQPSAEARFDQVRITLPGYKPVDLEGEPVALGR